MIKVVVHSSQILQIKRLLNAALHEIAFSSSLLILNQIISKVDIVQIAIKNININTQTIEEPVYV